ncbi:hypothetical protein EG68_01280 [Paragonimus skrjabini miyazakii]|uniref:Serpin domain-containing protein n=1 Tax=Paragonimus skrjabini miyazakii TaxID=59628 RepID=A0A8S9Z3I4_9TREM|nr:hypothetical protein EG68_01280 [Paragonimus skrjabini miyazakii]
MDDMATENMIKQSLSQFTVDFYDKIVTKQGNSLSNVFVSPLSIYTAMVMTMAGADGKTKTEVENASGLPEVLNHLRKPGALEDLLKKPFREIQLDLFLPKFKLSQCEPVNAKALLQQCGINTIFNPNEADLTKLCNSRKLFVSDLFHKAILEVDEEGATAAAATAVMMGVGCAMITPVVRVDRPFIVALICASTMPVFIGHVTHPESN